MPVWLDSMRLAVEHHTGARYNSVLANYYRTGADSVAWHADDEPELGSEPTIASLSFGSSRRFAIKSRADNSVMACFLDHGDLLVMSGRSQADYLHSITKTARSVSPRLNLTFRWTS
jgi:alkylated DNA repair dioxygenase AlkB